MEKKVEIEKSIVSIGFKRGSPLNKLSIIPVMKLDSQDMIHHSSSLLPLNSSAKSSSITIKRIEREGVRPKARYSFLGIAENEVEI